MLLHKVLRGVTELDAVVGFSTFFVSFFVALLSVCLSVCLSVPRWTLFIARESLSSRLTNDIILTLSTTWVTILVSRVTFSTPLM